MLEARWILDNHFNNEVGGGSKKPANGTTCLMSRALRAKKRQTFPVPGRPVPCVLPSASLPVMERRPPTLFGLALHSSRSFGQDSMLTDGSLSTQTFRPKPSDWFNYCSNVDLY